MGYEELRTCADCAHYEFRELCDDRETGRHSEWADWCKLQGCECHCVTGDAAFCRKFELPEDGAERSRTDYDGVDTREKIEHEASELVADYARNGSVCVPLMNGITELLDRQAAITERECDVASWKANYWEMRRQRDKLGAENYELSSRQCPHYHAAEHRCDIHDERGDGWMRLPKDMNGEPIHEGDVLESDAFGRIEVEGFVHDAVAFWSYDPQPARLATCPCSLTRHVHERTVEDVLAEFAEGIEGQNEDFKALCVKRCAEEIRELMGGAE